MVSLVVKLYSIESSREVMPNPFNRGLKKLLRSLFPKYAVVDHAKLIKSIDVRQIQKIYSESIIVGGVEYLQTTEMHYFYDKVANMSYYIPLYIKASDLHELARGNYYPFMVCQCE